MDWLLVTEVASACSRTAPTVVRVDASACRVMSVSVVDVLFRVVWVKPTVAIAASIFKRTPKTAVAVGSCAPAVRSAPVDNVHCLVSKV